MKLLIIGASGFIGNGCFNFFSKQYSTIGIDKINNNLNSVIIDADFSITQKLISENKFDVIINCAGSSNIHDSFVNPENDFTANVTFVQTILESIKKISPQTKFINLSSAAVYGNPSSLPIGETGKTNPLSPYGSHKLQSEKVLEQYSKDTNLKTISVRIFSAYGPGLKRQFFYDLYSKFISSSNKTELYGTGNESRDFIFISDIAEALEILITKASFNGEIYNLASGNESFINTTAKLFAQIANYKGEITFTNEQIEGYPINWKADVGKLAALGFTPKVTLEEGIKLYFNWIKNETL